MNETDIQAIMIDNKTINQRIENSLNVIFADIDITAAQGRQQLQKSYRNK